MIRFTIATSSGLCHTTPLHCAQYAYDTMIQLLNMRGNGRSDAVGSEKVGFLVGGAAIDEDANKVAPIIILIEDVSTRDVHVKCVLLCLRTEVNDKF